MILTYKDTSKLHGLVWYMLELRSEKTIENTMRRVIKAVPHLFRDEPLEIFLPIFQRDIDVFEMKTGCYAFVRSTSFQGLLRLKSVNGVVGLVTEGESNRPNKAIKAPADYVQTVIDDVETAFHKRADGIKVGSFVRLLEGETRDYCGIVETLRDGYAVVRVDLKTKVLRIETPVRNLLNLDHVPADRRVFYYCPLIDEFITDNGIDALNNIQEDLRLDPNWIIRKNQIEVPETAGKVKRYTRQRTVTALVKRYVIEGDHEPMSIARKVVAAIQNKEIKTPKNLFIVYCIIKNNLRNYFRKVDPKIANYREVIRVMGPQYKFSAQDIAALAPDLGVPVSTLEICKDGRSREARQQKNTERAHEDERKQLRRARRRERRRERKERQRLVELEKQRSKEIG